MENVGARTRTRTYYRCAAEDKIDGKSEAKRNGKTGSLVALGMLVPGAVLNASQ